MLVVVGGFDPVEGSGPWRVSWGASSAVNADFVEGKESRERMFGGCTLEVRSDTESDFDSKSESAASAESAESAESMDLSNFCRFEVRGGVDFAKTRRLGIFSSAGIIARRPIFVFRVGVEELISFSCRHDLQVTRCRRKRYLVGS